MVKNRYTKEQFEKDIKLLQSYIEENEKEGGSRVRHFKLIEADKKEMNVGYVKVNNSGTPLSAAKKLFKSLCHTKNLNGDDKLKLRSTFTIQETTNLSKKKIFGPYIGYYKKLSEKEKKEASRAGVQFEMRSVVKLVNSENENKKENKKRGGKKKKEIEDDLISNYDSEDEEYEQRKNMGGG
jgi:isopenicillin N synthase-like dioxygenase